MSPGTRAAWRLRQARHWLRCRLTQPAVVLMYHRVAALSNDPHLLAVTPEHFEQHLAVIRSHGRPLRLQDLVRDLRQGRVPRRAVIVTLDDGYADNLEVAKPLLGRYEVPATVFITTGLLGESREFWWDELDRVLLQSGTLPAVLRLRVNGRVYEWRLDEGSTYTDVEYQRHRSWHIECREDPGVRQRLFRDLFELIHPLPTRGRQEVLDQLTTWAGAQRVARRTHRTLTVEEVQRLAEGDLVEIGAHTVTHPALETLPVSEQRQEIQHSKARLEALLGKEVASFAYPHGSVTREAAATIRELGYTCACSSDAAPVYRPANRFQLPRLGVRDWDKAAFSRWLKWWIGG